MPKITKKLITSMERIIFKHPLLTDDHDFKVEYKCDCGKNIYFYSIGKPDKLIKCFNCQIIDIKQ